MFGSDISLTIEERGMTATQHEFDQLLGEHVALSKQYGAVQARCSRVLQAQRAEMARLEAEVLRLRAAVVQRDTALAAAHDDRAAFETSIAGLPRRAVLARRVDALMARIQSLMRERLHWQWHGSREAAALTPEDAAPGCITAEEVHQKSVLCLGDASHTSATRRVVELAGGAVLPQLKALDALDALDAGDDLAALEASLVAADLVICQTGCLSHGAYWRVRDHCRRTGKTCVMVDQPQVIRIVRGVQALREEA